MNSKLKYVICFPATSVHSVPDHCHCNDVGNLHRYSDIGHER